MHKVLSREPARQAHGDFERKTLIRPRVKLNDWNVLNGAKRWNDWNGNFLRL